MFWYSIWIFAQVSGNYFQDGGTTPQPGRQAHRLSKEQKLPGLRRRAATGTHHHAGAVIL